METATPLTLALLAALLLCPATVRAGEAPAAEPPPFAAPPAADLDGEFPWSVSLGTGAGGFVEFVDAFSNGGPVGYTSSRRTARFQLNARADRELNRWFRAGVAWTYNSWTERYDSAGVEVGSIDNSVHALMADVTLRYLRTGPLELYSGLAAGAGRWKQSGAGIGAGQSGVQSGLAFQLRYLGASLGTERLRAFLDLGVGFEGLLVGGLTLRF
jgi:opacity protein-like surface antigen